MILRVPDIRQTDTHDCGSAALSTVVRFHRRRAPKPLDLSSPLDGVDPRTLEALIRRSGWNALSGEMRLSDLQHFVKDRRPVVCLVTLDGCGHYVVVRGVTNRKVHCHDPLAGTVSMSRQEWVDQWHDVGRWGESFRHFGLVVWPA